MMRAGRVRLLAAACLTLALVLPPVCAPAAARDLGVRGATWPVAEPDLLLQIEARLAQLQRSGAMARFEAEARERAREMLEEPEPVPGIVPAGERSTRLFDPSIEVARDIRDSMARSLPPPGPASTPSRMHR